MRKQIIAGLTVAALTFGAIGIVQAYDKDDDMPRRGQNMEQMAEELGLTDAQRDALRNAMKDNFADMRDQMQGYHDTREQLMQLDPGAPDYQDKLNALVSQAQDSAKARILMRAEHRKEIYGILTPEQRKKFAGISSEYGRFRKDGWGKHHNRRDCD